MEQKENKYGVEEILKDIEIILNDVSKNKNLYINYAKICYGAMKFLNELLGQEKITFPININKIYDKLGIEVHKDNLNEFMWDSDPQKLNRIIGKISIRPDYVRSGSKSSIYVDEKAAPAIVNYALAHELAHYIMNRDKLRYTDEYCIMPMLPKLMEEMVADAFAIFLMIPFDMFLETFMNYIITEKEHGNTQITTENWLNHLGSVAAVPYYYVACAYQQIRHVAYLMYTLHTAKEEEKTEYEAAYGEEVMELYEKVKDKLEKKEIILLFQ